MKKPPLTGALRARKPAAYRCFLPDLTGLGGRFQHGTRGSARGNGARGIRTLGTRLGHIRFPSAHLQPLGHRSIRRDRDSPSERRRPCRRPPGRLARFRRPPAASSGPRAGAHSVRIPVPCLSAFQGTLQNPIISFGETGIRTLGAGDRHNGFRIRPIQPLSHLSISMP